MADKEKRVDPIISILGHDLGPWQLSLSLFIFLSKFPTGFVQLSSVFFLVPVNSTCVQPENITDPCDSDCEKVDYDRSVFEQTVIMEWDLICKNKWLGPLTQSLVMIGIMVGNMLFGMLADKLGRTYAFVLANSIQLFAGVAVSLSPWFWFFCVSRFLVAFSTGGSMITSFVIIMEMIGPSKREAMTILYQIPFNMGHALLPVCAYFLREWRWYNFSYSVVSVIYLLYICFLPESPRWLLTTGRTERAIAVLEKGAKMNKMPTENVRPTVEAAYAKIATQTVVKKATMRDLFRFPRLRVNTIAMALNWLVVCATYYGLSQYVTNLGGDVFLNVFIGAVLGLPGTIICVPMTKYVGRKPTLFLSTSLSGICLILLAFIPKLSDTLQVVLATTGLFGAAVTFPNVYLYSGELFPTVVRNSGLGLCSFIGRVGSIAAPFISDLATIYIWLPVLIYGIANVVAALATLLMPETKGALLPETIEEGESMGRKNE